MGAVAALGQAPWSIWPATLFGFLVIFWLLGAARSLRRAAWIGWAAGTGYFAIALFWIVEPFLVDIARHGWMAPFALVFMAGGFARFWGAAFALGHWFGGGRWQVLAAMLWLAAFEMLRGVVLTGFPWATIGHVWIGAPPAQLAAWGGAGALTLLTLMIAAAPMMLPRPVAGVLAGAAVLALGWGFGEARLSSIDVAMTDHTVRVVQPNAPQHQKWDPAYIETFLRRQLAMTAEPAETPLDLVIWPETSVATRLDHAEQIVPALALAADGVPLIFGGNDLVDGTYRNTMVLLDGAGEVAARYHKHHLVPFGEYIPLGDFLSDLGIAGMAARDGAGFGAGPGPVLLDVPALGKVLPLICYELIFPRHLRSAERPDLIVQITNDAWFGEISGPYQHLAQARLRAVEQGLGLIRSANTGVSAVIDPLGRVLKDTPLNEAGYFDAGVPAALPATLYAKTGDLPVWGAIILLLVGVSAARKRADH